MISGGCALLFGILAAVTGAIFIWFGLTEPYWAALIVGLAFVGYAFYLVRNSLAWLQLRPAESLVLFPDHFSIGTDEFPYSAFKGVRVHRIRTRKRINYLPAGVDETVIADVRIDDRVIQLRAGAGPATIFGPSLGQQAVDDFLRKLDVLQSQASHQRDPIETEPARR